MKQIPVGYQLYSAREDVERDMGKVLSELKRLGYDGVEFAGYFGHTAKELKQLLNDHGLAAVSSHVPVQAMRQDPFGTIAFLQELGCKYVAIPSVDGDHRPGTPGFPEMIRFIARFGRLCREGGIQLLYHNHDFEFVKVSDIYGLDFLYSAIDEECLKTEIDVCWVKYAGENPSAYLRKYAGHAPIVHLKDYVGVKGEGTPYGLIGETKKADETVAFEFRPFGHGSQDAKSVVEAGIDAGAEWFVVEQDLWYQRTPMEAAKMSIDTLYDLGIKQR